MDKKSTKNAAPAAGTAGETSVSSVAANATPAPGQINTAETVASPAPAAGEPPVVKVVEQGNETVVEAVPATDAATGAPVDTVVIVKPPKKKKTGLIVGIIVAVLLLLGGIGAAIWYFAVYQNPENVAFDAVNNLITAKNVSPHGAFTARVVENDDFSLNMTVTVESSSRHLPSENSLWLMLDLRDASGDPVTEDELKLKVGTIQMADGVAYLKLENLTETVDNILNLLLPATNCGPVATNCLPDPYDEVRSVFSEVADLIDDEWWQISLSDILDELDIETWQSDAIEELYTCALDAANADNSAELSRLYREHRFLSVEKFSNYDTHIDHATPFSASLDYDALADFLNATKRSSTPVAFYDCYNAAIKKASEHAGPEHDEADFGDANLSPDDSKDVTASDLKKLIPVDAEIILQIDEWSHTLRAVDASFDLNDEVATFSVAFDYTEHATSAPSEYRPIRELFEDLAELFADNEAPELPGVDFPIEIDSAFDFYGV